MLIVLKSVLLVSQQHCHRVVTDVAVTIVAVPLTAVSQLSSVKNRDVIQLFTPAQELQYLQRLKNPV